MPATLLLLSGCYAYLPATSGRSLAGRAAELSLTDSGAVVLGPVIGPAAQSVAGRVVGDGNGSYVVSLENVHHRDGHDVRWRGERIVIPRALTSAAGERRFSPTRTALFAALATTALVSARQAFAGEGSGGGGAGIGHTGPEK